jgi:hypothetical protein
VREKFRQIKPLKELSVKERGWTLDVLNVVRRLANSKFKIKNSKLPPNTFSNADIYRFEN